MFEIEVRDIVAWPTSELLNLWRSSSGSPPAEVEPPPEPLTLTEAATRFPTPTVYDATGRGNPRAEQREGSMHAVSLHHAAARWPTPKASPSGPDFARAERSGGGDDLVTAVARDARMFYPTPISRDFRSGLVSDEVYAKNSRPLTEVVARAEALENPNDPPVGQLNPEWVEWLMNWPVGWTLPDVPCTGVATWDAGPLTWWGAEPELPRLSPTAPRRVERLMAIGNGQVPLCAAAAFLCLLDTFRQSDQAHKEAAEPDPGFAFSCDSDDMDRVDLGSRAAAAAEIPRKKKKPSRPPDNTVPDGVSSAMADAVAENPFLEGSD